jgi:hypothetical protein
LTKHPTSLHGTYLSLSQGFAMISESFLGSSPFRVLGFVEHSQPRKQGFYGTATNADASIHLCCVPYWRRAFLLGRLLPKQPSN